MSRIAFIAAAPLLLAACASYPSGGSSASDTASFDQVETVEIALTNFAFGPDALELEAGKAYALQFTNEGFPHDYTAPEFFAAAQIAPEDAGSVVDGVVDVPPGGTVTVRLIPVAGTYEVLCVKPGHADLGMKGSITVS